MKRKRRTNRKKPAKVEEKSSGEENHDPNLNSQGEAIADEKPTSMVEEDQEEKLIFEQDSYKLILETMEKELKEQKFENKSPFNWKDDEDQEEISNLLLPKDHNDMFFSFQ